MRWLRPKSFREALTTAQRYLTLRPGRSAGSMSTGQRTPPRPTGLPSTDGMMTRTDWPTDGFSLSTTPMSATDAEQSWVWPSALSAVTLPVPGSRESAREWAECLLSLANVLEEEERAGQNSFAYAASRLVMASAELRRWADEET